MMRVLIPSVIFVATALFAHFFVLTNLPSFIMGKAHQAMAAQGVPMNQWVASPRQTPETQQIVRPSPDLAYAICRFDTSTSPVFITASTWDGYGSLSIFDAKTDNVFVASLARESDFGGVHIGPSEPADPSKASIIFEGRGIALIRRLAPTDALFDQATALVSEARCDPVMGD